MRRPSSCGEAVARSAAVEFGHEFAVGGAGGSKVVGAFFELLPQVEELLLKVQ
jgi:hypothetical protein